MSSALFISILLNIFLILYPGFVSKISSDYLSDKKFNYFHFGDLIVDRHSFNTTFLKNNVFNFFEDGSYISMERNNISRHLPDHTTLWTLDILIHHEIEIGDDENIYVLSRENYTYNTKNVFFDTVVKISPDGKIIYTWSTFDYLEELHKIHNTLELDDPNSDLEYNNWKQKIIEYYHANSIDYIIENKNSNDKRFQEGNLIVSLSFADLIIIIDKDSKNIVWSWGPNETDFIHTPRMLKNGNIIMFENGQDKKYSRIIELDPIDKKIVWEYLGTPKDSFFSSFNGAVAELPSGNLLITESTAGHVFELTKTKKIVWEYYNPALEQGYRELIYRANWIPDNIAESYIN